MRAKHFVVCCLFGLIVSFLLVILFFAVVPPDLFAFIYVFYFCHSGSLVGYTGHGDETRLHATRLFSTKANVRQSGAQGGKQRQTVLQSRPHWGAPHIFSNSPKKVSQQPPMFLRCLFLADNYSFEILYSEWTVKLTSLSRSLLPHRYRWRGHWTCWMTRSGTERPCLFSWMLRMQGNSTPCKIGQMQYFKIELFSPW